MSEAQSQSNATMKEQVTAVIDQILRPAIQQDGGDIHLVDVTDEGVVQVQLRGACVGCPSSTVTLRNGVERILKSKVEGVTEIVHI